MSAASPALPGALENARPMEAEPLHHGSHRNLVTRVTEAPRTSPVDAIVVSTARTAPYLREAARLATELKCTVVALCSRRATARAAIAEFERSAEGIRARAIDVSPSLFQLVPAFQTREMTQRSVFRRSTDLSFKRNLGLLLARAAGWQRVVLLDDDLKVDNPYDLQMAVNLLTDYSAVGLENVGFPDNSVVCHAHRQTKGKQDTFIGGGALAVNPLNEPGFFPDIYNEDWFFLLDAVKLKAAAIIGQAEQKAYDPFAGPDRARSEELGDTLAEGIYRQLDNGRRVQDADEDYWHDFLRIRRLFIEQVLERATNMPESGDTRRMIEALKAARGRHLRITPDFCVEFLRRWRIDRRTWQRHIAAKPVDMDVDVAIKELDLGAHCVSSCA